MTKEIVKQDKDLVKSITNEFMISKSPIKTFQQHHLIQLKELVDKLMAEANEKGEIPRELRHISKNLISLTDKMRRQDEGIKVNANISLSTSSFN